MSIVRINVLEVPPERAEVLEERFQNRAGEVESTPGFESFELLRPTDDSDRYFVYTRWESEEAFQAWVDSRAFQEGHAESARDEREGRKPAAAGSELLSFDVVLTASAD